MVKVWPSEGTNPPTKTTLSTPSMEAPLPPVWTSAAPVVGPAMLTSSSPVDDWV